MALNSRNCCVVGCKRGKSLFTFPLNKKMGERWIEAVQNPMLSALSYEEIKKRRLCICERHFRSRDMVPCYCVGNFSKKRVLSSVVPKLNLPVRNLGNNLVEIITIDDEEDNEPINENVPETVAQRIPTVETPGVTTEDCTKIAENTPSKDKDTSRVTQYKISISKIVENKPNKDTPGDIGDKDKNKVTDKGGGKMQVDAVTDNFQIIEEIVDKCITTDILQDVSDLNSSVAAEVEIPSTNEEETADSKKKSSEQTAGPVEKTTIHLSVNDLEKNNLNEKILFPINKNQLQQLNFKEQIDLNENIPININSVRIIEGNQTCRACLVKGINMKSVFSVDIDSKKRISEMIMSITSIKILSYDGLPDRICAKCIKDIKIAYSFKLMCEKHNNSLNNSVPSDEENENEQVPSLSYTEKIRLKRLNMKKQYITENPEVDYILIDDFVTQDDIMDVVSDRLYCQENNTKLLRSEYKFNNKTKVNKDRFKEQKLPDGLYKCTRCTKTFAFKKSLYEHLKSHKDEDENAGKIKEEERLRKEKEEERMRKEKEEEERVRKKKEEEEELMRKKIALDHNYFATDILEQRQQNKQIDSEFLTDQFINAINKPWIEDVFPCQYCLYAFSTQAYLDQHITSHHKSKDKIKPEVL